MANTGSTIIDQAPSTTPSNWNFNANASFNSLVNTPDNGGQVVNVKAYGAVGDGSHDDTTAINTAITYVNSVGGGIAYLPPGTYKVTSAIVPLSKVKIQGAGNATILAGYGTNFSVMQNLASVGSPTTDIEICDLMIDGTNVTNTSSYSPAYKGLYIQYSKRLKLHGLYVYNTLASGLGVDFLVDSEIDRCVLDTCGRSFSVGGTVGSNGIGIGTGGYAVESWIVSNCIAVNCGNVGIMCEAQNSVTNSNYMTFSNCLSYNNGTGYLDSGVSRVSFVNCWAWGNTLRSGFIVNAGDIAIGSGVYMPQDVIFTGCHAYGQTSSSGFTIDDDQLANDVQLGYNIILTNCTSAYNSVRGFYLHNTSKISLVNCRAYANQQHGVLAFSDSPTTPMNKLHIEGGEYYNNGTSFNNTYDGIRVGSSGSGLFSDCMIANVKAYDDNLVTLSDGAMTSSSKVLTSANAGFSPSDVGKSITVNGAGPASGNLTTTIASWQGLGQVTLTASASTTVTGATVTYGVALQRYGISIAGTTNTTSVRVLNCDLRGNNSAFNTGTISTLEVRGCVGYNPIGQASISVTASPFTYTAGNSPEDVFITGGTVSSIVKGSTTLAAATNFPVHLEPNQSVVVTYSVAPTMVADKY